ncbi:MAG: hypothetical protein CVV08_19335 [Gammaproteobacteria bacterium HGW-Gammaproteobacteria-12]|nr:MAG: hypothetical protein CVV08_19335 [Gammaproteobacteria bacterium HGW-Gammaproteobacteria-12]
MTLLRSLLIALLIVSLMGCAQRQSEQRLEAAQTCHEVENCQQDAPKSEPGVGEQLALGVVSVAVAVVAIPLFLISYMVICPFSDGGLCGS